MPIQKGPANLGTGVIDATELASGSVTTAKIADSAVTAAKMGTDATLGVSDKANTSTGYFSLPAGTTGQRPASPANGMIRYNSTTAYNEIYQSSAWATIASIGNIASSSTAFQASQSTGTTGSTTANAYTDWSGGNITLPAGTYYFSFSGCLEVQSISGGSSTVQGLISVLVMTDTSNNFIWGSAGNYVHINNTYNVETLSSAFIYTVSATTSYKLRFGYANNSGSFTTTGIYLRGNMGINSSPATLTAIKLY